MNKRFMIVCIAILMSLSLSSCKSSDYEEADSLFRSRKYLEAAKIFNELGDYRDSKQRMERCIDSRVDPILKDTMRYNKYADAISALDSFNEITDCSERIAVLMDDCVEEYVFRREYDEAIDVMEKHAGVGDYTSKIEEVKQKKEYLAQYQQAISYFEQGKYDEGFEALKEVPDDYEYAGLMRSSFKGMSNCPFNGKHTYKHPILGSSQSVTFNAGFHEEYFALHIHVEVYYPDGTLYQKKDYYPALDRIENNSVWVSEYTWTIDKYGKLIEQQKGNIYVYNN